MSACLVDIPTLFYCLIGCSTNVAGWLPDLSLYSLGFRASDLDNFQMSPSVFVTVGDDVVANHLKGQVGGWKVLLPVLKQGQAGQDRPSQRRSNWRTVTDLKLMKEQELKEKLNLHDPNRDLKLCNILGKG